MNTPSRHRLALPDGSTITVNRVNTQPGAIFSDWGGWHRVYGYTIRAECGCLILRGRDLHGPCHRYTDAEAPTAREMTASLLSFLLAAVDHYNRHVFSLKRDLDTYSAHFTADADEWAYGVCDWLEAASLDLEPL